MTPIGSRVMRRDFGSNLYDLIDAKMQQRNVLALYSAAAVAIDKWEPRFRLTECAIDRAAPDGVVGLVLRGTYFPRGHKGDYSIAEDNRGITVRVG
jgi:phage baseplate assembly protein W